MPAKTSPKDFRTLVTNGVAFAKAKRWRIIKNYCLTQFQDYRGKTTTCLCPMMAVWLQGLDEKKQAKYLNARAIIPAATLARNLAKRLGYHPQVIRQFMGMFDNIPDDLPWPRGMSKAAQAQAKAAGDLAVELRSKLRPKAPYELR